MPTFEMPSSSLPSTPDTRQRRPSGGLARSRASDPSTTPAGPPAGVFGSFTPVGPPPSSPFGSSQLGTRDDRPRGRPRLASSDLESQPAQPRPPPSFGLGRGDYLGRTKNGTPARPLWGRPVESASSHDSEMGSDGDYDAGGETTNGLGDASAYDDGAETDGQHPDEDDDPFQNTTSQGFRHPLDLGAFGSRMDSSLLTRSAGISRRQLESPPKSAGGLRPDGTTLLPKPGRFSGNRAEESAIPSVARHLSTIVETAELHEDDKMIIMTEDRISLLDRWEARTLSDSSVVTDPFSFVPGDLLKLWEEFSGPTSPVGHDASIGPSEHATPVAKANFIARFLLTLYHPPSRRAVQEIMQTQGSDSQRAFRRLSSPSPGKPAPFPRVLLDWLETQHNPYPGTYDDVRSFQPNPSHHSYFWDVTLSAVLRGKINEAIKLLQLADFKHLVSVAEEYRNSAESADSPLRNTRHAIMKAIQTLQQCPAVTSGDWNLVGKPWAVFRLRASQASRDLVADVEPAHADADELAGSNFSAEHFGIHNNEGGASSYTRASREAESRIPWTIYQHLKSLYGILRGSVTEIMSLAQDWLEASVGLTVWWDGQTETPLNEGWTPQASRPNRDHFISPQDYELESLYIERLAWSFRHATSEQSGNPFQVDSFNRVELALASALEGDMEAVVSVLRTWSLVIAAAIVRVGRRGGWLDPSGADTVMGDLDQSDLMVLSQDGSKLTSWKDNVLLAYAERLNAQQVFRCDDVTRHYQTLQVLDNTIIREGWELSMEVLARLSNAEFASKRISQLLDELPLDSVNRVDKLLRVCRDIGLIAQANKIAEKFADWLAGHTELHGDTMIYYARSHQRGKLRTVTNMLVASCLVQSAAWPSDPRLDTRLQLLISSPKETLSQISLGDLEAAEMLQFHVSGYASLREFYRLRDESLRAPPAPARPRPNPRELARKRKALAILVTLINSAADSIHGGLYDERRESVMHVDSLLVLLAEATAFLDQPQRVVSLPQIFDLLKAIEDLQTVTHRVYARCEELFRSTLSSQPPSQVPSPRAKLKKSLSALTASTAFSMLDSAMFDEAPHAEEPVGDSGVLVQGDVRRAWDWRQAFPPDVTGRDVLQRLRLSLAKELAQAWLAGEEFAL